MHCLSGFNAIYFLDKGGILFEVATDPPGFAHDEPVASLGESLKLPSWLEPNRAQIEQILLPVTLPYIKKGDQS